MVTMVDLTIVNGFVFTRHLTWRKTAPEGREHRHWQGLEVIVQLQLPRARIGTDGHGGEACGSGRSWWLVLLLISRTFELLVACVENPSKPQNTRDL